VTLRSLVDAYPLPFLVIGRDYRVVTVNEAFRRHYRTNGEDLVGRHCYELSHGNDRPCHELGEDCPYQHVQAGTDAYSCTHIHRDGSGQTHRVRVTGYVLEDADGVRLLGESLEAVSPLTEGVSDEKVDLMIGEAPAFTEARRQLLLAARSDFPVLLLGETGTGKELAAEFLHHHSPRRGEPYLTLDCTTISDPLFEAEVFGHERGAYTGSVGEKEGLFGLAHGGTLFLDEIGELSLDSQAKLLRALETGEYRRVGGQRLHRANVRVICATNRHLWELVERGLFREDLYYRISCLTVHLPALRHRRGDVPMLVRRFLANVPGSGVRQPWVTEDALALLALQDYPGNIRQLRNLVFAAVAHSPEGCIDVDGVASALRSVNGGSPMQRPADTPDDHAILVPDSGKGNGDDSTLAGIERRYIVQLLEECDGNRRAVAERLGISTRTLYRRLKQYELR
jgi:transcriptional regulator with PAS, ATPase and Fis domain